MLKKQGILLVTALLLVGCSEEPRSIVYFSANIEEASALLKGPCVEKPDSVVKGDCDRAAIAVRQFETRERRAKIQADNKRDRENGNLMPVVR